MSINIALIGSGIFATTEHLPAIEACSKLRLKAVYSRSIKSAEKLAVGMEGVSLYSDDSDDSKSYDALLARDDIQAVVIALPIVNQPEFIKKALAAGKHVLSEKPIAKDVKTAQSLLEEAKKSSANWCVAENFRFLKAYLYGAAKVQALGRVLNFRTKVAVMMQSTNKYLATEWRKTPDYQGGFLLDGGIHFIAATRTMLGADNNPTKIAAFTSQLQPHLPPVDTIDSIWQCDSGVKGSFCASYGSPELGVECVVNCTEGSVHVGGFPRAVSVVIRGEVIEKRAFPEDKSGVKMEIEAWARGLVEKTVDPRQTAEEGFKDLEILEAMLKSGAQDGMPINLRSNLPFMFNPH